MLVEQSDRYRMEPPNNKNLKITHSLFINDLIVYQQKHEKMKMVNETIAKAIQDAGECYKVEKCAEIVSNRGLMVKAEALNAFAERTWI